MHDEYVTSGVIDFTLRIKQVIEKKDFEKFSALFSPVAQINVFGRFYRMEQFLEKASAMLMEFEQPEFDFTSIDEGEVQEASAFAGFTVKSSSLNKETWERMSQLTNVNLGLERKINEDGRWSIKELTVAHVKHVIEEREIPIFPQSTFSPIEPSPSGIKGLFTRIWYRFWERIS